LSFLPGSVEAAPNGSFAIALQLDGASDTVSLAPLQIKFDPAQLLLTDISAGELLTHDGKQVSAAKEIHNETGEGSLTLTRLPGTGGISGSGTVATLVFSTVGKGTGKISVTEASLKNSQSQVQPVLLGSIPVTVQ
jgi:general secretion pathway protein D